MADFARAVALVLKHEGGYVWNLNDPGGPTNFGITAGVYSQAIGRIASALDIQTMSVDAARNIYKMRYWVGQNIESQDVAERLLDMSVLRGLTAAVKSAQVVLNLTADGVFGPKTLAAINAMDSGEFLNKFRSQCVRAFASIVKGRPASAEFLPNWVARAEEMADVVSSLGQKSPARIA